MTRCQHLVHVFGANAGSFTSYGVLKGGGFKGGGVGNPRFPK